MNVKQRPTSQIAKLEKPSFRIAFCAKPGFRYGALKPYCQEIEYVTDGFSTDLENLSWQVAETMSDYDPDKDVIIPTGTGIVNILIGYYIANKFPESSVAVAFFQKEVTKFNRTVVPENYEFYRFYPSKAMKLWI